MGLVTYKCGRGWGGVSKCALALGHDGDCNPYQGRFFSKTLKAIFEGARCFFCHSADDVAQVAKWLKPGDTVAVPSGTVLPRGRMVPNVTYEVR